MKKTRQQNMIMRATDYMASRLTEKDSLQKSVINISVIHGSIGITYLNKDNSYLIEEWQLDEGYDLKYRTEIHESLLAI